MKIHQQIIKVLFGVGLLASMLVYGPRLISNQLPGVVDPVAKVFIEVRQNTQMIAYKTNLLAKSPVVSFANPVLGADTTDFSDTWRAARSMGRQHEGVDIFAARGTYVVSPIDGYVARMGFGNRGGNYVFVTGPAGERYYFAHLNEIDPWLQTGQVVRADETIIGTVGTTGNAENTSPHLHLGIYTGTGAINPYNRIENNQL